MSAKTDSILEDLKTLTLLEASELPAQVQRRLKKSKSKPNLTSSWTKFRLTRRSPC
jgi:ribosomal protein L7/L12